MKRIDQIIALKVDLDKLIYRYANEFDLDYHCIVGILEDKKLGVLLGEGMVFDDEDEDEDDGQINIDNFENE